MLQRFRFKDLCKGFCLGWAAMVLSLPVISHALQSAANNQSTAMTKRDLAEHGLVLLIPQEAAYAEELQKLKLDSQPGMAVAKPGSVILKNASQHGLVAYGIRWKIADPKGFLGTRDVMHLEPRALLDSGRARAEQISIPAGASRLITVEGLIRNPEALKDFSSSLLEPGFSPASVQLDFAVFDDGEVVGPDEIGMLPTFQATINAKQDLMEEISAKLAQGQTLRQILEALQSSIPKAPITHAPLDPVGTYAALRQQYLNELTTTEHNFGEQMAMQSLQYHKYNTRPNIHRRDSSPK